MGCKDVEVRKSKFVAKNQFLFRIPAFTKQIKYFKCLIFNFKDTQRMQTTFWKPHKMTLSLFSCTLCYVSVIEIQRYFAGHLDEVRCSLCHPFSITSEVFIIRKKIK